MKTLTLSLLLIGASMTPALVAAAESIPAQATEVRPNVYRYTDSSGKTWLYSRTPFGISKQEEKPQAQPAPANSNLTKVTDLGDKVRFETKTPFGPSVRVKAKSELTDAEKALVDAQKPAAKPADASAEKATEKAADKPAAKPADKPAEKQ